MFEETNILELLSNPMFWAIVILVTVAVGVVLVIRDVLHTKERPSIRRYHYTRRNRRLHRTA
jgi:hypothetical protein